MPHTKVSGAKRHAYYLAHRDEILAKAKARRIDPVEREKARAFTAAWHLAHSNPLADFPDTPHGYTRYRYGCRCEICTLANTRAHVRGGYQRKQLYGITTEQFEAMVLCQGGQCGICSVTMTEGRGWGTTTHIDHDHVTGKVRGLLCGRCNAALGQLNIDTGGLEVVQTYLAMA